MARTRLLAGAREVAGLIRLPGRVQRFYLRALLIALRVRDRFSLTAAIRPRDLRALLQLADGRASAVELGTGTGWASIALALADSGRTVTTYDVREPTHRHRYLRLLDPPTLEQIVFEGGAAEDGPRAGIDVDFLYIDVSLHTKELTLASFRAWEPSVVPGGVVAFHDYGERFPGVREAVEELGLEGEVKGGVFTWRKEPFASRP